MKKEVLNLFKLTRYLNTGDKITHVGYFDNAQASIDFFLNICPSEEGRKLKINHLYAPESGSNSLLQEFYFAESGKQLPLNPKTLEDLK
jgi:hypothetical protein